MTDEADRIVCRDLPNELMALGLAASVLSGIAGFGEEPTGLLIPTVAGQVRRRHYAFALRGKQAVGYVGWALCAEDVAQAWAEGRRAPTFEECLTGDVVMVMTIAATAPGTLDRLVDHLRTLYPGQCYVGRRFGAAGPRVRRGTLRPHSEDRRPA